LNHRKLALLTLIGIILIALGVATITLALCSNYSVGTYSDVEVTAEYPDTGSVHARQWAGVRWKIHVEYVADTEPVYEYYQILPGSTSEYFDSYASPIKATRIFCVYASTYIPYSATQPDASAGAGETNAGWCIY
jgi:hypothetical protein